MVEMYIRWHKLLQTVYPEHNWVIWSFRIISKSQLTDKANRIDFIAWLGKELKIRSLDEWYRISWTQVNDKISKPDVFQQYRLEQFLQEAYPNFEWNESKLQWKHHGNVRASQRMLARIVEEIFPNSGNLNLFKKDNFLQR